MAIIITDNTVCDFHIYLFIFLSNSVSAHVFPS